MDPNAKGDKVEAMVLSDLVNREFDVLIPFSESNRYDLVIQGEAGFHKLQCKSGRYKQDRIIFSTKSSRPNTTGSTREDYRGDIDYFAVYSFGTEETYLVPISKAANGEMTLRTQPPDNGQSKGINWAEDYLIDAQLRDL
ncbi:group I intron-associated PD-(D/E)XK endonuclease [Natronoarchaeum mannanilyticum]|uniref:PD(D/E)XK endonuclease domain-containing protein n=1 Tax=Natronoarchaeum mannanilyticum TaxID=926360 RepID=A0AAV3T8A1_9EURY